MDLKGILSKGVGALKGLVGKPQDEPDLKEGQNRPGLKETQAKILESLRNEQGTFRTEGKKEGKKGEKNPELTDTEKLANLRG